MLAQTDWIADLDAHAACLAVEQWHEVRMRAEAELFVMAAHWADLHGDSPGMPSGGALPGMERVRQVGADGTPEVAEFAAMELGALQGMGHVAAQHLVRDALNVRHRHPLLWAKVCAGSVRVWQARKVAQLCASAGLDAERAGWVDEQTTPYAGALPWGRFESLLEIKIVEADPEAAEERRLAAAMQRFVRTGQSSEHGLKTLVARASAGDMIFFVAVADRIAQILALQGDRDPVDVRRSKAIGILANPAHALEVLEWGALHGDGAAAGGEGEVSDAGHAEGDAAQSDAAGSAADADAQWRSATSIRRRTTPTTRLPGRDLHAAAARGPRKCCGRRRDFVHLDPRECWSDAVSDENAGSEGRAAAPPGARRSAPLTRAQVVELLGHRRVRVVPVLDLADEQAVDGYEVPPRMAEALHLRTPACASPWGTNTSRPRTRTTWCPSCRRRGEGLPVRPGRATWPRCPGSRTGSRPTAGGGCASPLRASTSGGRRTASVSGSTGPVRRRSAGKAPP